MTRPLNTLVLGGCLVRRPLRSLPGIQQKLDWSRFGHIRTVHSFGEMFQILDVLAGRKDVSAELRPLTGVGDTLKPVDNQVLREIDLALIELGSPVDITFRGVTVNRNRIQSLFRPVEALGKEASRLCDKWIRVGLIGMRDDVRQNLGEEISALLPDGDDAELCRALLREARAEKTDIENGFRKMREMLGCPLAAVIFVFRYMPDGRPVIWPPGAREEVIAAAEKLDLPFFEPTKMVQDYGVSAALEKDSRHYTKEFLPVVGEAIVQFAQSAHARSRARTPA